MIDRVGTAVSVKHSAIQRYTHSAGKTQLTVHPVPIEPPHYETAATIPFIGLIATTTYAVPVDLQPAPIRAMQTALSIQHHLDGLICNRGAARRLGLTSCSVQPPLV